MKTQRKSCKDRLRELQAEFKEVAKEEKKNKSKPNKAIEKSPYSSLPVIHLKAEKQTKVKKAENKARKQQRAAYALEILENFFTESYADHLYDTMEKEELIDFCINYYESWLKQMSHGPNTRSLDELTPPPVYDEDFDIPDSQWDEYCEYYDKHQPKDVEEICDLRTKFKKKKKKSRKTYYKKGLMVYDPLFKHSRIADEKQFVKDLKRISYENELRLKEFEGMMNRLVGDTYKPNPELLKSFKDKTELIQKRARKRIRDITKFTPEPLPFIIS